MEKKAKVVNWMTVKEAQMWEDLWEGMKNYAEIIWYPNSRHTTPEEDTAIQETLKRTIKDNPTRPNRK